MSLNNWILNDLLKVAEEIEKLNYSFFKEGNSIGFSGKERVYKTIKNLRSALFHGLYEKYPYEKEEIKILVENNLRIVAIELRDLIQKVLNLRCDKDKSHIENKGCNVCHDTAEQKVIEFLQKLPQIRKLLQTDIDAAYNGDPAAFDKEEILLAYPSIEAITIHRMAHELYKLKVPLIPRIMSEYAHQVTGIDINPGATIGSHFFIDHGTGVVIGETCFIGENVKIYQGVTLGAKSFQVDENNMPIKGGKRHPNIGNNVVIYAGATILGGDTIIGDNSVIGGNVWLTSSVQPNSTVLNSQPKPSILKV